ncbi:MAG: hypothetical protein HZA01_02275 [Nitrospinae bacterium]|nr:hypothetical protein [Nitrospinota bacterium]
MIFLLVHFFENCRLYFQVVEQSRRLPTRQGHEKVPEKEINGRRISIFKTEKYKGKIGIKVFSEVVETVGAIDEIKIKDKVCDSLQVAFIDFLDILLPQKVDV